PTPLPPISTLFPYTTLFRSIEDQGMHIPIRHCCNTAATIAFPELQLDMVRIGIGLYGLFPSREFIGKLPLKAVMVFKTEILFLKDRKSTRLNSSHVSISYAV